MAAARDRTVALPVTATRSTRARSTPWIDPMSTSELSQRCAAVVPVHPIQSNPIQSNPIQSIQSRHRPATRNASPQTRARMGSHNTGTGDRHGRSDSRAGLSMHYARTCVRARREQGRAFLTDGRMGSLVQRSSGRERRIKQSAAHAEGPLAEAACLPACACSRAWACARASVCLCACLCVRLCVCVRVRACTCVYVHVCMCACVCV